MGTAATEVSGQPSCDVLSARRWMAGDESAGGHHDAVDAVSALGRLQFKKRLTHNAEKGGEWLCCGGDMPRVCRFNRQDS